MGKKNTKREQKEENKGKNKGNHIKKKKHDANMRSGRRPSPEDRVAVGWYDQSYDISS